MRLGANGTLALERSKVAIGFTSPSDDAADLANKVTEDSTL